ncbi:MAG: LamG domain-containing protein, partial [Planctomycetota bacterium]
MSKGKFYLVILIVMVGSAGSYGDVILQVDAGDCGPTQSGWISLGSCGTHTNVGGTGIDVVLETGNPSMCECRNPGGSGTLADVEATLLFANDENYSPGSDFILTLRNLTSGSDYTVYSYHSRSDEGDTTIPNVTVTGATNVTKPSSIVQNHAIMDNPAEISFTAGAGDVVIRYQGPDGGCAGCQAFFNGFELVETISGTTVQFASDSSGDVEAVTPALVEVILNNALAGETYTVDYAVIGGTATGGGVDYTLAAGTLTFAPNSVSEFISTDIVDDGQDEDDETIVIELSNPVGLDLQLGSPTQDTYTIVDPRPTAELDEASSSGMEDVTPVYVSVSLSAPGTETITVDYDVIGGTATGGGVDYTLDPGTLTFNVNDVTKNIVIDIVSDANEQEPAETIIIGLSNPVGAKLGTQTQYTYTIVSEMYAPFPDSDTVGLWLFDEADYPHTTLTDASEYEKADLCLMDGGSIVSGQYGNALSIAGGDYAVSYAGFAGKVPEEHLREPDGTPSGLWGPTEGSGPLLNGLAGSTWTIELWLNPSTVGSGISIIDLGWAYDNGVSLVLNSTSFELTNYYAGVQLTCSTSLSAGVWQHVAFTYDAAAGGHFVDGVEQSAPTVSSVTVQSVPNLQVPTDREHESRGFESMSYEQRRQNRFNFAVGTDRSASGTLDGMVDEMRISDVVRYSGSFT